MTFHINFWQLETIDSATRRRILRRAEADISEATAAVEPIITDVRTRGDAALIDCARRFDGVTIQGGIAATDADFDAAYARMQRPEHASRLAAIRHLSENARIHAAQQMAHAETAWLDCVEPGIYAGERITPIASVGLYVPRGKGACFPSVMYQLCAYAMAAGVPHIAVCTPPAENGGFDDEVLIAADMCGVRALYKAGGAQAVAAFAFGTETVPKMHKIYGPGSVYVSAARKLLRDVIDPGLAAGPSEAIVLADASAHIENTALDLINEAEHGPDSASILLTDSRVLAEGVRDALPAIVAKLPPERRTYCEAVFAGYGGIVLCDSIDAAVAFANEYAVEHLILKVDDPNTIAPQLTECGELLIGEATPITLANYGIGVNGVLPTGQSARTQSATTVHAFLKRMSIAYVTPSGYDALASDAAILADREGFAGHAAVVRQRDTRAFADRDVFSPATFIERCKKS